MRPRVDVVLVRTHSPGNLGSAARAARAFGARLLLVDPRADASHPDARAFASGAEDVLDGAPRLGSLGELAGGASAVLALTSARGRRDRGLPPRWSWAAARRAADDGPVVLVLGPERSGLTTEELRAATGLLSLPTVPAFPTLNLAQAAAAALALLQRPGRIAPAREVGAGADDVERVARSLALALERCGHLRGPRDDGTLAEMTAVLKRARLSRRESALWLGALRALSRNP